MSKDVNFRIGDSVEVEYQSIGKNGGLRRFVGICIKKGGKGLLQNVVLRNVVDGVGVELGFCINSPNVLRIERVRIGKKRVRRAKLYYLRDKALSNSMA